MPRQIEAARVHQVAEATAHRLLINIDLGSLPNLQPAIIKGLLQPGDTIPSLAESIYQSSKKIQKLEKGLVVVRRKKRIRAQREKLGQLFDLSHDVAESLTYQQKGHQAGMSYDTMPTILALENQALGITKNDLPRIFDQAVFKKPAEIDPKNAQDVIQTLLNRHPRRRTVNSEELGDALRATAFLPREERIAVLPKLLKLIHRRHPRPTRKELESIFIGLNLQDENFTRFNGISNVLEPRMKTLLKDLGWYFIEGQTSTTIPDIFIDPTNFGVSEEVVQNTGWLVDLQTSPTVIF